MQYRTLLPILIHASPILIHALHILIHWLGFRLSAPYLYSCIVYLNTLSRLSGPFLNTCIAYLNTLSRLSAPYTNSLKTRQPIRIEHPRLSATNQNRVLRHPNRHYVTRELIDPREFMQLASEIFAISSSSFVRVMSKKVHAGSFVVSVCRFSIRLQRTVFGRSPRNQFLKGVSYHDRLRYYTVLHHYRKALYNCNYDVISTLIPAQMMSGVTNFQMI